MGIENVKKWVDIWNSQEQGQFGKQSTLATFEINSRSKITKKKSVLTSYNWNSEKKIIH